MKTLSSIVAAALVTAVREASGASIWRNRGAAARPVEDGFYQRAVDAISGVSAIAFTPLADLARAPVERGLPFVTVEPRASPPTVVGSLVNRIIGKRDKPCGPGTVSPVDVTDAITCLSNAMNATLALNKDSWAYCIRGSAVAYICPYSDFEKNKTDILDTYARIHDRCGVGMVGWTAIRGPGNWNAGYTNSNGTFCSLTFKAGDPLGPNNGTRARRRDIPALGQGDG